MTLPGEKPEIDEPEVEFKKEEQLEKGIEVDLNETEQKQPVKESSLDAEEIRKLHRSNAYYARQLEKTQRDMQRMAEQMGQFQTKPATQQEVEPEELDKYDKIAQKDWKKAVRELGREEAEGVIRKEHEARLQQNQKFQREQELSDSKKIVLEAYPDIEDIETPEGREYLKVIQEDTRILSNTNGPEIAMARMERRLKNQGITPSAIAGDIKQEADKEVDRRSRAQAGLQPKGRTVQSNKVTLTNAEKEHCDRMGISYTEFAQMYKLGSQSFREGVSV